MTKQRQNIRGTESVLLGKNNEGERVWMPIPSWDCDWYWGFGYVQTKDNHQHWDTSIVGHNNKKDGSYCHNPFESKFFSETTFNSTEGWELAELFKRFYVLRESAEMFGRGGCHISHPHDYLKNEAWAKHINEVLIPETTKRILEILSPKKVTV